MTGDKPPHVAMSAPDNTSDFHPPHAEFGQSLDIGFREPADSNNQDIQLMRFFGARRRASDVLLLAARHGAT